jgi:hypothetical protein
MLTFSELHERLLQAGVEDPVEAALADAVKLADAEEMSDGGRDFLKKTLAMTANILRKAHGAIELVQARASVMAAREETAQDIALDAALDEIIN